jgi:hypothetical protein
MESMEEIKPLLETINILSLPTYKRNIKRLKKYHSMLACHKENVTVKGLNELCSH